MLFTRLHVAVGFPGRLLRECTGWWLVAFSLLSKLRHSKQYFEFAFGFGTIQTTSFLINHSFNVDVFISIQLKYFFCVFRFRVIKVQVIYLFILCFVAVLLTFYYYFSNCILCAIFLSAIQSIFRYRHLLFSIFAELVIIEKILRYNLKHKHN